MSDLERMIAEARQWRRFYRDRSAGIEAAAAAIREKALCDARAAIVGRTDPEFTFRPVLP